MKIPSSGQIPNNEPLKSNEQTKGIEERQTRKSNSKDVSPIQKSDQIHISGRAKEVERVFEIVRSTPDVRSSKVEALKQAVESGQYKVPAEIVAEKILDAGRAEFLR